MSSSNVSSVTSHFSTAAEGFTTTLSSTASSGATTLALTSVSGLTNGNVFVGIVEPGTVGKEQTFTGIVDTAGTQITGVVWTRGSNTGHNAGVTIVDYVSGTGHNMMTKGLLEEHKQTGAHSDITADSITATTGTFTSLTISGTASAEGWSPLGATPNTVTANGNRSYNMVFNSNDLTDTLSPGMRLKATRTVTAPTQCADLESSSSHYFNKTSPAGMTFTDDFVVSAWIKLESYTGTNMVIASRYNGTSGWNFNINGSGQVELVSRNAGAGNYSLVSSSQSVPLNKWVHVAVQQDMSAFTATTTTSYVMIDGVNVPATVSRAGTNPTALVQAGNLEIGTCNSGTLPFDGKIAQVAIYSAKVTQANVLATISQGLTGSETSLISAYSLSNSLTDLNTGNANNLTAQNSAVATATDTPFAGGSVGTTEYGIVTAAAFSTNTTLTVQVPEGYALPTTGGISAVSYSISKIPYGFPAQEDKWTITSVLGASKSQSSPTNDTWYNLGGSLLVPAGSWRVDYTSKLQVVSGAGQTYLAAYATLGTTASTNDTEMNAENTQSSASLTQVDSLVTASKVYNPTTPTTYYLNALRGNGSTGQLLMTVVTRIRAVLAYL